LKLTLQELDELTDLTFSPVFKTLLKEMNNQVNLLEEAVISFQYKPGKEEELHYKKIRAQGAREFLNAFIRQMETSKRKSIQSQVESNPRLASK
jgi:hypothetical protein